MRSNNDKKSLQPSTGGVFVAHPAVPPIVIPAVMSDVKEKPKSHRFSSHRQTPRGRPIEQLAAEVDTFVTDISKSNAHHVVDEKGKKVINLEHLTVIKNSLQIVAEGYERRSEFKIKERMSARKVELDNLIATAEKDYADKQAAHQRAVEGIDVRLDELHRHLTEVQGQTLIMQFKTMQQFQYYNNKIRDEVASVNDALDSQGCCSRFFCCWPSAAIVKQQRQLQLLRDEQDALASNDVTKVSTVLSARIEADRQLLLKQREALALDQPEDNMQKYRDERTKLQAEIDANRFDYYHTISPAIMLNLVRLQSFLGRMLRKIDNAKTAAQVKGDTSKIGLLHAVSVIVGAFLDKFNKLCGDYVCRPPQNEENAISYAQYCERFHKLKEDEKRLLIAGPPDTDDKGYDETVAKIQQLDESIFSEHVASADPSDVNALSALSSPSIKV